MKLILLIAMAGLVLGGAFLAAIGAVEGDKTPQERRDLAEAAIKKGNFKDAYAGFQRLATNADDEPDKVSNDLHQAISALERLGRTDEIDDFREKVIAAHAKNWRLLHAAASSFLVGNENYGFIIAGKFYRGNHRGNDGRQVWTVKRDRVRALQLMQQALDAVENDPDKTERGKFYFSLADMLMNSRFGGGAWQLQYSTDLSKLPDYENSYPAYYYGGNRDRGAPVNADGTPVYHKLVKSWKEAATDGERWRWALMQAAETSPENAAKSSLMFANFLHEQFGVQTMAQYGFGRRFGGAESDDDTKKDESGPYAVSTLGEDETIARLASGIKCFKLPAEFNFIHLFQTLADAGKGESAEKATDALATLFENRQQYDRSAEYWNKAIANFGDPKDHRKHQVEQIVGNWAGFEQLETEAAGKDASAYMLFRNGKHVSFEAVEVDVPKLLADVKAYIKNKPKANQFTWNKLSIDNIGWRLVQDNQKQYLKSKVAEWEMDLEPREKHFDKRFKVTIPVKKAGAYLITAKMKGGNESRIILWHADTAIVKKTLDNGSYFFVADAVTGQPIAKANLEYFGYENAGPTAGIFRPT